MGRGGSLTDRVKLGIVAESSGALLLQVTGPLVDFYFSDAEGEVSHSFWRLGTDPQGTGAALVLRDEHGHPQPLYFTHDDRLAAHVGDPSGKPAGKNASDLPTPLGLYASSLNGRLAELVSGDPIETYETRRDLHDRLRSLMLSHAAAVRVSTTAAPSAVEVHIERLRAGATALTAMRWAVRLPQLAMFIAPARAPVHRCLDLEGLWSELCPHATVTRALAQVDVLSLEERLLDDDDSLPVHGRARSRREIQFDFQPPCEAMTTEISRERVRSLLIVDGRTQVVSDHVLDTNLRCLTCLNQGAPELCSVERVRRRRGAVPLLEGL